MKRDGASTSLWQANRPDYQPANGWNKDEVYDILIIGGGITGLTTALLLQQEGKKCLVAEGQTLGFGTSGGTTAHLNTLVDATYPTIEDNFGKQGARQVANATAGAIALVESLTKKYQISSGFSYQTAWLYAQEEQHIEQLDQVYEASRRAGLTVEQADTIPVPFSFKKAYRFGGQGQIHASNYLLGLAEAFEKAGGVIVQRCLVQDLTHDDPLRATTSIGDIRARQVVYATHQPPGISIFNFRLAPYRSYASAFTLKNDNYPQGLAYDSKENYNYFRTQESDGQRYVIAGGFDHKTGHEDNTEQIFAELEAYQRAHFEVAEFAYRWSSQYYESVDGLPYIGSFPGQDGVYLGTGFGGNGVTYGTVTAMILCDMLLGRPSPYEEVFSPARIKPVASFTNFVKENADVVSMFVGKRFSYEKITELADLAPGEAKTVKWEGTTLALYKDENSRVYALDPVCPHAKCIVVWNSGEKSWDCPCHGARYAVDGGLLTGPARTGLTRLEWEKLPVS
jgi:glycine/D-amino acid oxidase-like deaminating enzyme/nitrite reductase/ring-hydroxylating ferredoxin subunit